MADKIGRLADFRFLFFLWRERGNDFFEAGFAAQRVPLTALISNPYPNVRIALKSHRRACIGKAGFAYN